MSESAMRDLETTQLDAQLLYPGFWKAYRWPPLNSVKLCFQTEPSRTLTSNPFIKSRPSGGCNFAKLPGRSSANIAPKSLKKAPTRTRQSLIYPSTATRRFWRVDKKPLTH